MRGPFFKSSHFAAKRGGKACTDTIKANSASCTAPCGYDGSDGAQNQASKFYGHDLDFHGKVETRRRLGGKSKSFFWWN
jgi:hypothetical protein